jgi:hypothetical protein
MLINFVPNTVSASYDTVKTTDVKSTWYDDSDEDGSCCGNVYDVSLSYYSTYAKVRMRAEANSYGEWAEAWVRYEASNGGNSYGYYVSTSGTYRIKVDFELSGFYDGGEDDTQFVIEIELYYVDGTTHEPVSTGSYSLTSTSDHTFPGDPLTLYASGYILGGHYIFAQIYIYLRAETPTFSWQGESPIRHDFWDGANKININSVAYQHQESPSCPPIC